MSDQSLAATDTVTPAGGQRRKLHFIGKQAGTFWLNGPDGTPYAVGANSQNEYIDVPAEHVEFMLSRQLPGAAGPMFELVEQPEETTDDSTSTGGKRSRKKTGDNSSDDSTATGDNSQDTGQPATGDNTDPNNPPASPEATGQGQ